MKDIIRFSLIGSGHELIGWFSTRLQSLKVPTQFSKNPGYSVTKPFKSTSSSVMNFSPRHSHNGIVRRSVGYKSGLSRSRSKSGKGSQAAHGERFGAGRNSNRCRCIQPDREALHHRSTSVCMYRLKFRLELLPYRSSPPLVPMSFATESRSVGSYRVGRVAGRN